MGSGLELTYDVATVMTLWTPYVNSRPDPILLLSRNRRVPARHARGFEALHESAEAVRGRIVWSDQTDVTRRLNRGLEAGGPQDRVHKHPAESFVAKILGRSVGGREHTAFAAGGAAIRARPGHRQLPL